MFVTLRQALGEGLAKGQSGCLPPSLRSSWPTSTTVPKETVFDLQIGNILVQMPPLMEDNL